MKNFCKAEKLSRNRLPIAERAEVRFSAAIPGAAKAARNG
jgi:hypothetical protein